MGFRWPRLVHERQFPRASRRRPSKRAYLLITLFALLLVLFPFLFWYLTWFGRRLSDSQIDSYLADASKPRHAQHALVQIGERMVARHESGALVSSQVVGWPAAR